jgi:hypothetical protein
MFYDKLSYMASLCSEGKVLPIGKAWHEALISGVAKVSRMPSICSWALILTQNAHRKI